MDQYTHKFHILGSALLPIPKESRSDDDQIMSSHYENEAIIHIAGTNEDKFWSIDSLVCIDMKEMHKLRDKH